MMIWSGVKCIDSYLGEREDQPCNSKDPVHQHFPNKVILESERRAVLQRFAFFKKNEFTSGIMEYCPDFSIPPLSALCVLDKNLTSRA